MLNKELLLSNTTQKKPTFTVYNYVPNSRVRVYYFDDSDDTFDVITGENVYENVRRVSIISLEAEFLMSPNNVNVRLDDYHYNAFVVDATKDAYVIMDYN